MFIHGCHGNKNNLQTKKQKKKLLLLMKIILILEVWLSFVCSDNSGNLNATFWYQNHHNGMSGYPANIENDK